MNEYGRKTSFGGRDELLDCGDFCVGMWEKKGPPLVDSWFLDMCFHECVCML